CLRLPAYSASAKDICFIGAQPFSSWDSRISPDLEVFFRVSLRRYPFVCRSQQKNDKRSASDDDAHDPAAHETPYPKNPKRYICITRSPDDDTP
ncbi:hypothetical protein, partial [Pseudomonas gessardii]|uniref:hypothetical protein n=1 Tax=Pseudomonas gessardii TaxID=78544 RepID=UPI001CA42603